MSERSLPASSTVNKNVFSALPSIDVRQFASVILRPRSVNTLETVAKRPGRSAVTTRSATGYSGAAGRYAHVPAKCGAQGEPAPRRVVRLGLLVPWTALLASAPLSYFPSATVKWFWVAFDLTILAILLLLQHRFRPALVTTQADPCKPDTRASEAARTQTHEQAKQSTRVSLTHEQAKQTHEQAKQDRSPSSARITPTRVRSFLSRRSAGPILSCA